MTDPKAVHRRDQLQAAVTEVAWLVAEYYRQLYHHGVPRGDALQLAATLQTSLVRSVKP